MSRVEYTPKEVIENKLLASLEQQGNVAIILTLQELDLLIDALKTHQFDKFPGPISNRSKDFREDLQKLRRGAFPEA